MWKLLLLSKQLLVCIWRVFNNLANIVGKGAAEKAILSSERYAAEEALAIGMVDKVVSKDKLLDAAKSQMDKLTVFSGEKAFLMIN